MRMSATVFHSKRHLFFWIAVAAVFLCASPLFVVYSTQVYADLPVALEFYASPRGSERAVDADAREMIAEMRPQVPDSQAVLSSIAADYAYLHRMRVVRVLDFATPATPAGVRRDLCHGP